MPKHGERVEQSGGFVLADFRGKILQAMAGNQDDEIVELHART